ncbi:MAG: cupin domain-containing protein [Gammaproteobacteria bacterium]
MKNNIFNDIPDPLPAELLETLYQKNNVHIERIVSRGHTSPSGHWYDQDGDEWVVLLQGNAIIEYENDQPNAVLTAGDYLLIPAHLKHRVAWTDSETIWLAVHIHQGE